MSDEQPKQIMPLEKLRLTPEFERLSEKQKLCMATYISNGYDIISAIRTAYPCKSDYDAQIRSYPWMKSPKVIMCLSLHFGNTSLVSMADQRDMMVRILSKAILKGEIPVRLLRAIRLMAELQGWMNGPVMESYSVAKTLGYGEGSNGNSDEVFPHVNQENYTLIGGDGLKRKIDTVIKAMNKRVYQPVPAKKSPAKTVKAETEQRTKERKEKKKDEPVWDLSDYANE